MKEKIIKVLVIIVIIVGLFFLSEISGDRSNDKNVNNTTSSKVDLTGNPLVSEGDSWTEEETKEIEEITFSEFKNIMKKDEITIVMLATDTCSWCNYQKPVLKHVLYKYDNVVVKYLDASSLTSEDQDFLAKLDENLEQIGTPTFIAVKNNKAVLVKPSAMDERGLVSMFQELGLVDESVNTNPLVKDGEVWDKNEEKEVESITFKELKQYVNKDQTTLIMLGTEGCIWCVYQKPVLAHFYFEHSKLNIKYLDLNTLDADGAEYLKELDKNLEEIATPTHIVVKDGKVIATRTGALTLDGLTELFKEVGEL